MGSRGGILTGYWEERWHCEWTWAGYIVTWDGEVVFCLEMDMMYHALTGLGKYRWHTDCTWAEY